MQQKSDNHHSVHWWAITASVSVLLAACPVVTAASASVQSAVDAMKRGDFAAAYPIWVELANAGDDKAAIEVGLMHHIGRGRPVSYPDAYNWYLKALRKNGDAWNNIGVMYRDGLGVPKNRRIAYLMFLNVHMTGLGNEATVMRANRNLRREIGELPVTDKQASLCYTMEYVHAFIESRGALTDIPVMYRASPERKRIRELGWWAPGEVASFDCPGET